MSLIEALFDAELHIGSARFSGERSSETRSESAPRSRARDARYGRGPSV